MFGLTTDQTMVLPEGAEISFEFGGGGGDRNSSTNKQWSRRVNHQQCQVFSSHNVIGGGRSGAHQTFGDELLKRPTTLQVLKIGSVRSIEQGEGEEDEDEDGDGEELPVDERSSISSISHSCRR